MPFKRADDDKPRASSDAATTPTWFVYMLECSGDRIYTGIATDVSARYAKHRSGRGAAFTRINKPLRILASMPCTNRSTASKTESALKKWRRPEKLLWAAQWAWEGNVNA